MPFKLGQTEVVHFLHNCLGQAPLIHGILCAKNGKNRLGIPGSAWLKL